MPYRFLLSLNIILILSGCNLGKHDKRLENVASLASDYPREALDSLTMIDYAGLNEADRHYYDLLLIKSSDKAYIVHESDSLILDVIEYYEHKGNNKILPEALYYGGRVYSDLGDYPTALKYFQSALELLPPETTQISLRSSVLSQTGRLLNTLRLYDQSIPFIEASIECDRALGNITNEVHDLHLLGGVYLRSHSYDEAERYFKEAYEKSEGLSSAMLTKSRMFIAAAKQGLGQNDSALMLIRGVPDMVKPIVRNTALSYALGIYLDAGITDTAYIYAKQLVESPDFSNKKSGFLALLSPSLQKYSDMDSLRSYSYSYGRALEKTLNENENQQAISQQSIYNYQLHERIKAEIERDNRRLTFYINMAILLSLILGIFVLILNVRNKNNIIKLRSALENIGQLERIISLKNNGNVELPSDNVALEQKPDNPNESVSELRGRLRNRLLRLYRNNNEHRTIDPG